MVQRALGRSTWRGRKKLRGVLYGTPRKEIISRRKDGLNTDERLSKMKLKN